MVRFFVYGRSTCNYCVEAVRVLKNLKIEHHFFDLEPEHLEEAKQFYNRTTVPIVLKNNKNTGKVVLIGGCDNLKEYLDV